MKLAGINLPEYDPQADPDFDCLTWPDTPCRLAVEDRGMAALVQSADRENAYETAQAVLGITHPPIILGTAHVHVRYN